MIYFVRSTDGVDYRIGLWVDGIWIPGTRADAIRDNRILDEAGSFVIGIEKR